MNYKIAQLTITSGQKDQSIGDVFVAQPDGQKEELAGKLFVVAEIESTRSVDSNLLNFIINEINHNYYENEKLILRERVSTLKVEHIFESALIKTNKNLADYLKNENITFDPTLFNATIGVVFNNEIHFANLGKNRVFLIYKNKKDNLYHSVDIAAKTKNKDEFEEINLAKLFHNVISGTIPDEGYFVVTNEALPEYLSGKQFIEIISTLPPAGAAEQIKNTLTSINSYISFFTVIIKNTIGSPKIFSKIEETSTAKSSPIPAITKTEEATERLLSPSGIINLKNKFGFKKYLEKAADLFNYAGVNSAATNRPIFIKDKIFFNKQSYLQNLSKLFKHLKDIGIYIINVLIYLFKALTNLKKLGSNLKMAWKKTITSTISLKNWFVGLKIANKIYIAIIVLCIIVLAVNLILLKKKNITNQNQEKYTNIADQIEQKQNQVDASLLYNDQARATTLFSEIKTLMVQLPNKTKEEQDAINKFTNKLNEQISKINKAVVIAPTEIINFASTGENVNPTKMAWLGADKQIYVLDNNAKSLYDVSLSSKSVKNIAIDDKIIGSLNYPVVDNNKNIYFLKNNGFVKFEIGTSTPIFSTLSLKNTTMEQDVAGVTIFNNKIYLVNKKDSQIYKYDKLTGTPLTGTTWLKETADLTNATDISIDGKIYILAKNQILIFANGKKEDFKLDDVMPALEEPKRLFVSTDFNFIYLLEPKNNRLLVFNKQGTLISQFVSDKFNDLRDFIVDEAGKKIYILNGSYLYSIDASFIKK